VPFRSPPADNVPGSAVINGKIWVFGGGAPYNGASRTRDVPLAFTMTQIYDPATNSWSTGPALNVARSLPGGTAVGSTAVAVAGYDGVGATLTSVETSSNTLLPCGSVTATPTSPPSTNTPTATVTTAPPSVTPTTGVPSVTPTTGAPSATPTTVVPSRTPTTGPTGTPGGPPTSTAVVPPSATRTSGPPPPTATPCAITFTDVHPTDYFYEPVRYLYCHGVISGYADNTFRPYNNTTRGQMVKIVVLGFGYPIQTPATPTFSDVPVSHPFYQFVETAAANNIVSGYADGTFRPQNNVTRGQLSKIDVIAARWTLLNPPESSRTFTDVLPNTAFYETVETAACHGIISGYTCGGPGEPCDAQGRAYFRQNNDATRGQIAKIVSLAVTETPTRRL